MKKTIFTILTLATVAIGGNAQTDTYTLSQCLKKGLENNYSLRITRNEEEIAHNNATLANNTDTIPKINKTAPIVKEINSVLEKLNHGVNDIKYTIAVIGSAETNASRIFASNSFNALPSSHHFVYYIIFSIIMLLIFSNLRKIYKTSRSKSGGFKNLQYTSN
mgnify:CR=1 FL=1